MSPRALALTSAAAVALAAGRAFAAPAPTAPLASAYDQRLRQSYEAAEAFQGPLDGGWAVVGLRRGRRLLELQLADDGAGPVGGAWRDLPSGAVGMIAPAAVSNDAFTTRFDVGVVPCRLTLHRTADGRWTGQLRRGDELFDVGLERAPPWAGR